MKKIKNVTIKNLKILKDISLDLGDLTLITGVNSSGKSTFIQSLLLLKQNQELIKKINNNKFLEYSLQKNNVSKEDQELNNKVLELLKRDNKSPLDLNGKYVKLGEKKDIFNQGTYNENIILNIEPEDIEIFQYIYNNKDLSIDIISKNKVPVESIVNLFADDFQYINTDRIQPNTTYSLSEIEIRKNLIGLKGEYTAHYLDENRHNSLNIIKLQHKKAKTKQLLENVSLWLGEISNGIEVLAKKYSDIQKVGLSYKYTFGNDVTNEYTPMNVGFGITYVLPIIVAILKSKPNDLLIIENPESHLHPAGQSKIAELCAIASSNGVQIIVETHSDHFLNGIRVATKEEILKPEDSKVYFFEKEDETMSTKVHKLEIDENGRINQDWPEGFFDEWDNKLNELIW
ncbi:MAG: DUF3696 domain-containing protein [Campylobacterota bacterium]|nr:DUF3696 domain-containing protein [Campylobacterota bacterium]